jgi:hypothetical protein
MSNTNVIETSLEGWVMMKEGKFWGEVYPSDGKSMATMGWVDSFENARISKGKEKPPTKTWFTYTGHPDSIKLNQGEWVYFTQTKTTTLNL